MRQIIFVFTILSMAMSSAFSQNNMANNIDNSNIALEGYSAVSYADLGLAQKGVKDYKSTYQDVAYYFTSAEQKRSFDSNPSKYLPQYGGFCAFGIYAGAKFRVDPNKFISEDGKYFLFLNNLELDAKELWLNEQSQSSLIATANQNWKKLSTTHN